jgi:hypothetical protein
MTFNYQDTASTEISASFSYTTNFGAKLVSAAIEPISGIFHSFWIEPSHPCNEGDNGAKQSPILTFTYQRTVVTRLGWLLMELSSQSGLQKQYFSSSYSMALWARGKMSFSRRPIL